MPSFSWHYIDLHYFCCFTRNGVAPLVGVSWNLLIQFGCVLVGGSLVLGAVGATVIVWFGSFRVLLCERLGGDTVLQFLLEFLLIREFIRDIKGVITT